jgi:phage terminase large subunit-like protein
MKLSARTKQNIKWIEDNLHVPEGRMVGQKVKISPAQKEWMELIYGTPTRMFICSIPRKNGKTSFSAMLLLLHLVGHEAVPNGQLFSAAQSRDQAAILFALAAKMVRMSSYLSEYVSIKESGKQLVCAELGTVYRALSAEASTALGLSPSLVIHDELGAVRGPKSDLYDALETAGSAQAAPLSIVISTQAPGPSDLLSTLIDDALTNADPTIKCILYSVPIDADPFDKKVLAKAQPNWHLMNHAEVYKQASDAKRMVSRENSFRNLVCNQRVESKNPFITRGIWLENAAQPDDIAGRTVYGGLDLSSVSDLTALVLVSNTGDVHSTFWLPSEGLKEKAGHDRVPYDIWAREGHLLTTPGRAIEYEYIAEYLRGLFDRCHVAQLAFDRYNMRFLRPWLERVGFTEEELTRFIEFGQGFGSMSPALRELESQLLSKKLKHGGHPVLTMCAANAVAVEGPTAGTRKFAKAQATSRIDGMVALAMAVGVMPNETVGPSIYETQELRTF